jgi:hypothetical protein
MPKSASKSASKKPNAAPPPVTRDQAKVQLLTTMVALKDEILRASDEKVRALKWAALNDFDKDAGSLEALLSQLEERVSGWRGDAPEGTSIVAPLVLKRREAVEARFSSDQVSASDFADTLAVVLPEFRRDFLEAVARNFGESVSIEAFLEACERAAGVPAVVEPEAAAAAPDVVATPVAADTADAAAPPAAAAATPEPEPAPEPAPEPEAAPATPPAATPKPSLLSRMSSAFGSSRKKKAADAEEVAEDVEEEVVADEAVAAPAPA